MAGGFPTQRAKKVESISMSWRQGKTVFGAWSHVRIFIEKILTAETFILMWYDVYLSLQWHNECDGISDHQSFDCLFKCLFRHRSKKTSKLHVTGLCKENPLATGGFPSHRASSTENVSIWWLHHDIETHAERISLRLSSPPNDNQWENIIYNWRPLKSWS